MITKEGKLVIAIAVTLAAFVLTNIVWACALYYSVKAVRP